MRTSSEPELHTPAEKLQYFLDYGLMKTLVLIAAVIFLVILVRNITSKPPEYAIAIGIYDSSMSQEQVKALESELKDALGSDLPAAVDNGFHIVNDQDQMRIVALSEEKRIDAVIAGKETFEYLAGYGYFRDLEADCDPVFLTEHKDSLVTCAGLAVGENGLLEEDGNGRGVSAAYGIRLNSSLFEPYVNDLEEPVLGVIYESERLALIEKLIASAH